MDFSREQQAFRGTLRASLEESLSPLAAQIDQEESYPIDLIGEFGRLGLFGLTVPKEHGGLGLDTATYSIAIEEVSRVCASVGISISAHNSLCCAPIVQFGSSSQQRRYLPRLATGQMVGGFGLTEPGSGSDVHSMQTRAVRRRNHYVLDGSKYFITNLGLAGVYVVGAHTYLDETSIGISLFLVEDGLRGFESGKPEDKLGVRGSHTGGLFFDQVEIPADNLLGEEGKGFEQAMQTIESGRIGIAAMALGIAQATLDFSLDVVNRDFQAGRLGSRHQSVQWKLADMGTEVEAARLLVWKAAWLKDHGRPFRKEASMAKLFASEVSSRVTEAALQIIGRRGCSGEYPIERYLRDAKLTEIGEGTSEIQRIVIAKELLATVRHHLAGDG